MGEGEVRKAVVAFCLAACCAVLVGCAKKPERGAVSGTVTLDGQPLKSGLIRFLPADGQTATADAQIADGKYTATVPPGDKKVTINSNKVTGKKEVYPGAVNGPTVDTVVEILPERYHVRTELTYTVTAGAQEKDFPLTSGK